VTKIVSGFGCSGGWYLVAVCVIDLVFGAVGLLVAVMARPRRSSACLRVLMRRLQDKAPGRVEKINPAFTSQRCSACGQVDPKSRESQAVFWCTACGYACHADVNAARNIAAGHAVTARGDFRSAGPVNREPQLLTSFTGRQ
jgi:hypothetical protein